MSSLLFKWIKSRFIFFISITIQDDGRDLQDLSSIMGIITGFFYIIYLWRQRKNSVQMS